LRENRNIDFVRLMNELCVGLGCCGGIRDGQPSHVTDFIPAAGPVTAKDFANWALLAEGLDPLVELDLRRAIVNAFVRHMRTSTVDATELVW